MHRRAVEPAGAGQIAGGAVGRLAVVVHQPAVGAIDHRQAATVVAIGVAGVADQEGLVRAGVVIIDSGAVRSLLDHPVLAAVRAPDPWADAFIVDGVVRRAVGEGLAQVVGAIDIAVALARGDRDGLDRRGGGEGGDIRRGDQRRRRALGQRKAGDWRAGGGRGRGLFSVLVAGRQTQCGDGGGGEQELAIAHARLLVFGPAQ